MTSEIKDRKPKRKPASTGFKPAQFINHTFSEDDRRSFKAWQAEHGEEVWDMLDRLLDDGYALSVKPDAYTGAVAAYISPVTPENPNSGYILSGRARSCEMAALSVLYRHYALFEADWPTDMPTRNGLDDD